MNMNTHIRVPKLLLVLLVSSFALSQADLYGGNASPTGKGLGPLPPFADRWKEFPPLPPFKDRWKEFPPLPPFGDRWKGFPPLPIYCNDPKTKCFSKAIHCPKQCPSLRPTDNLAKACFIDCNKRCEAVCKRRKPNCEGIGAACYDPRFVGGDGIMFYFHGKSKREFSLVSDTNLQINARFIGVRPAGRSRDFTWIQALGLIFNTHTFTLEAKTVPSWNATVDQFSFTYDGTPVSINSGHLSTWSSPNSALHVDRTATVNGITVTLPGVFEISARVVPVTEEDDRIHKYGIPSDNCFAHLEVQFKFFGLSEKVEGVLGQTYRPDFKNPVKRGVPMPVMSGEDKFMISSLLAADCKNCIFSPDHQVESQTSALVLDTAAATLDCTSRMSNGYGVVCRR